MSYGIKYSGSIPSLDGNVYTAEILEDGFVGASTPITLAGKALIVRWGQQNSDKDTPILPSSAEVQILDPSDAVIAALAVAHDEKYRLRIKKGASVYWIGKVLTNQYEASLDLRPRSQKLNAVDALGQLQNLDFTLTSRDSVIKTIAAILNLLGLDLEIQVACNWYTPEITAGTDPLGALKIDREVFREEDGSYKKCYEVLNAILARFGLQLKQAGGVWKVFQREILGAALTYYSYDKTGTLLGSTAGHNPIVSVSDEYSVRRSGGRKLAKVPFKKTIARYLPQTDFKKLIPNNSFESWTVIPGGLPVGWTPEAGTTIELTSGVDGLLAASIRTSDHNQFYDDPVDYLELTDATAAVGMGHTLRFRTSARLIQEPFRTTYPDLPRHLWMEIQVGDYYLTKGSSTNGIYTDSPAAWIHKDVVTGTQKRIPWRGTVGEADYWGATFDWVEFALDAPALSLPAHGGVIRIRLYESIDQINGSLAATDVHGVAWDKIEVDILLAGVPGIGLQTIAFDSATQNTAERDAVDLSIGDGFSTASRSTITVNGDVLVTRNWKRGAYAGEDKTGKSIDKMLAETFLRTQKMSALEVHRATYVRRAAFGAALEIDNVLQLDGSRRFVPVELTRELKSGAATGEWIELRTDDTNIAFEESAIIDESAGGGGSGSGGGSTSTAYATKASYIDKPIAVINYDGVLNTYHGLEVDNISGDNPVLFHRVSDGRWVTGLRTSTDRGLQSGTFSGLRPVVTDQSVDTFTGKLWGEDFKFSADGSYDIGLSAASRPRDLFLTRNAVVPGVLTAGSIAVTSYGDFAGSVRIGYGGGAAILLDGTDGNIPAGSVGIYESGGAFSVTARSNAYFDIDNDNNGTGHSFVFRHNGGVVLATLTDGGAFTLGATAGNGTTTAYIGQLNIGTTMVISSARNISNVGTINTTGHITIAGGASSAYFQAQSNGGVYAGLIMQTGGAARWLFGKDNSTETGANAGSDLTINRYDDAGAWVQTTFRNRRSDGLFLFYNGIEASSHLTLTGVLYLKSNSNVLNKAGSGWLTWFTRNTAGSETVVDLNYLGSITGVSSASITGFGSIILSSSITPSVELISTNASQYAGAGLHLKVSNASGGKFVLFMQKDSAGASTGFGSLRTRWSEGGDYVDFLHINESGKKITFNSGKTAGMSYGNVNIANGSLEMAGTVLVDGSRNVTAAAIDADSVVTDELTIYSATAYPSQSILIKFQTVSVGSLFRIEQTGNFLKIQSDWAGVRDHFVLTRASGALDATLYGKMTVTGSLNVNQAVGNVRDVVWQTGGSPRWVARATPAAESGSNVGSDFELRARDDAGDDLGSVLTFARNTGAPTIGSFGAGALAFKTNNATRWYLNGSSGHLIPNADNTYDIGGTSYNVRNVHIAGEHISPSATLAQFRGTAGTDGFLKFRGSVGAVYGYVGRFNRNGDSVSGGSYYTFLSNGMYHTAGSDETVWEVENQYVDGQAILLNYNNIGFWFANATTTPQSNVVAARKAYIDGSGNFGFDGALTHSASVAHTLGGSLTVASTITSTSGYLVAGGGRVQSSSTAPEFRFNETDAAADSKLLRLTVNGSVLYAQALTDADAHQRYLFSADRSNSYFRVYGDLQHDTFSRSTTYTARSIGWAISSGGHADLRTAYIDELHVKAFIADLEQALAGAQIISKSVTRLASDFALPVAGASADMYVEEFAGFTGRVFENGDVVRIRVFTRGAEPNYGGPSSLTIADAWGTVTFVSRDGSTNPPRQRWTFSRSSGGSAGTASGTVAAGTLVLDYGVTGSGFYEVDVTSGSPFARAATWTSHPQSGTVTRTQFGHLGGGKYGIKGMATNGTDEIFRIDQDGANIAGWGIAATYIRKSFTANSDSWEAYLNANNGGVYGYHLGNSSAAGTELRWLSIGTIVDHTGADTGRLGLAMYDAAGSVIFALRDNGSHSIAGWDITSSQIRKYSGASPGWGMSLQLLNSKPLIQLYATDWGGGHHITIGNALYAHTSAGAFGRKTTDAIGAGWDSATDVGGIAVNVNNTTVFLVGKYNGLEGAFIAGFSFTDATISATNFSVVSGAANTARVEVGSSSNMAGINSPNASGDIAFWAGSTHANRATANFNVTAGGTMTAIGAVIKSATSGRRFELSSFNLQFYDSVGTKMLEIRPPSSVAGPAEFDTAGILWKNDARFHTAAVFTSDATATTLWSYTVPIWTSVLVVAHVTAMSDGDNAAGYLLRAVFKKNETTVSQVGTTEQSFVRESSAGWDATIDTNGGDLRIRVTGAAATSINWRAQIYVTVAADAPL